MEGEAGTPPWRTKSDRSVVERRTRTGCLENDVAKQWTLQPIACLASVLCNIYVGMRQHALKTKHKAAWNSESAPGPRSIGSRLVLSQNLQTSIGN